jgi:Acetyltransferase (GNAT) family
MSFLEPRPVSKAQKRLFCRLSRERMKGLEPSTVAWQGRETRASRAGTEESVSSHLALRGRSRLVWYPFRYPHPERYPRWYPCRLRPRSSCASTAASPSTRRSSASTDTRSSGASVRRGLSPGRPVGGRGAAACPAVHAGQGIGTALVAYVLATAVELNTKAACRAVVVAALNSQARSWWERLGFERFDPDDEHCPELYLLTTEIDVPCAVFADMVAAHSGQDALHSVARRRWSETSASRWSSS